MIDTDPAFGQQLFNVSVRQCVPEIPADCHDDHIRREPESRERGPRRTYPTRATRHQLTLPCPSSLDATDPLTMPSRCLSPYSSTVCTQRLVTAKDTAFMTAGSGGGVRVLLGNLKAGYSHRLQFPRWVRLPGGGNHRLA